MKLRAIVRNAAVLPIELYRRMISPLLPRSCIYTPSCSSYAREAILRLGVLPGALLGLARLGRCVGSLYSGGQDPVPDAFSFRSMGQGYGRFWKWRARRNPGGSGNPRGAGDTIPEGRDQSP